jgi:hypothetical protein
MYTDDGAWGERQVDCGHKIKRVVASGETEQYGGKVHTARGILCLHPGGGTDLPRLFKTYITRKWGVEGGGGTNNVYTCK